MAFALAGMYCVKCLFCHSMLHTYTILVIFTGRSYKIVSLLSTLFLTQNEYSFKNENFVNKKIIPNNVIYPYNISTCEGNWQSLKTARLNKIGKMLNFKYL